MIVTYSIMDDYLYNLYNNVVGNVLLLNDFHRLALLLQFLPK